MEKRQAHSPMEMLREHIKSYLPTILLGLMSLVIVDILQLFIPIVLKDAINFLTQSIPNPNAFLKYPISILGLAVSIAVFRYFWRYFILGQAKAFERDLRSKLYGHTQKLSIGTIESHTTGDIMARFTNDLNAVRMAAGMGLVALVDGTLLGLAALVFMLHINPTLTALCLLPMPFVAVITKVLTSRMGRGFEASQKDFANLTEKVREAISGIRVLKSFSQEEWGAGRIQMAARLYAQTNLSLARHLSFFLPLTAIFTNISLCILLSFGGRQAILGELDAGQFVAFLSYLGILTWPMMAVGWVANLFQKGKAALIRITAILNEEEEEYERKEHLEPPHAQEITIRDLSFSFNGSHFMLFVPELRIPLGKSVAIVGRVASGKSTLLNIIARLIQVPPNRIFYGTLDVTEIPLCHWRRLFGYATQEPIIFSTTIEENISFGRPKKGEEDLKDLLNSSGLTLDKDIQEQPQRFLIELGLNLSGGQRQRVSIARAIYDNPEILILDDALSMVDVKTERHVLQTILSKRKGKTNIIVSHRPSVLMMVDYIYVMDAGQIVEHGKPQELIAKKGYFYSLYLQEKIRG